MNENLIEARKLKIKIPKDLLTLNKLFEDKGFELFIVGGYLRDAFLNIKNTDIDLCSSATPDEVEELLKGSGFKWTLINKRLGTYKISTRNSAVHFEYTTLRKERYDYGHSPSEVEFVSEIEVDAQRRDFTVNSIYYSLKTKEFIDPFHGIDDCLNHTLRLINSEVFDSDGLRIMRMLRLAYTKDLKIARTTYNKAKLRAPLLDEIAHERVAKEMREVFNYNQSIMDKKLNERFSGYDFCRGLFELDILTNVFTALESYLDMDAFYDVVQIEDYAGLADYDVVACLIYALAQGYEAVTHTETPPEFYFDMLSVQGLMLPRNIAVKYRVVVDGLVTLNKMYDKSLYMNYVQLFYPFLADIVISRAHLTKNMSDEQLARLAITDKLMEANNIPRSFDELNLKPVDLLTRFPDLPPNQINTMLDCALIIATRNRNNDKEFLLNELEKIVNKDGDDKL